MNDTKDEAKTYADHGIYRVNGRWCKATPHGVSVLLKDEMIDTIIKPDDGKASGDNGTQSEGV